MTKLEDYLKLDLNQFFTDLEQSLTIKNIDSETDPETDPEVKRSKLEKWRRSRLDQLGRCKIIKDVECRQMQRKGYMSPDMAHNFEERSRNLYNRLREETQRIYDKKMELIDSSKVA